MKKELKDIFQKHYAETESPVDVEQLFKAIEAKRKPKKKRRWLFLLPLGFLGAIFIYSFFRLPSEGTVAKTTTLEESRESMMQTAENIDYKLQTSEDKTQASESDARNYSLEKESSKQIEKVKRSTSHKPFVNGKKQIKQGLNKTSQSSNETQISEAVVYRHIDEKDDSVPAESVMSTESDNKQTKGKDFSSFPPAIDYRSKISPLVSIDKIYSTIDLEGRPEVSLDLLPNREQLTAPKSEISRRLCLKLIAGGLNYKEARTASSANIQELVDNLDESTRPFSSLDFNVILEYPLFKRISISSGVSYTRLSELFEWKGSYLVDANRNYVADRNPEDIRYSLVGISTEQHYFEHIGRDVLKYNKRHLIDIPLALSYRVLDKKLKTDLYIGAAFNVFYQEKGYTLTQDLVPAKMEGDEKVATEWNLGLEFGYELTSAFSALLRTELATRKITNPYFDQRVLTPSLKVGVAYSF